MFSGSSDAQTSIGSIAGGAVGGILVAVIVIVAVLFIVRRRRGSLGKFALP